MSDRLEWFDVTVPAGTLIAAPFSQSLAFRQGIVTEIDIKILDGPCGTLGFYITAGGSQYVPRTPGSFVIPNDDYLVWPVQNAISSGAWGIVAYNLDSFVHLIQVAFHVNETGGVASPVTAAASSSVDTLTAALSQVVPDVQNLPGPLSPDALINSTPLGSNLTSSVAPLDLVSILSGVENGAP